MAITKHRAYSAAIASALTTELNSLANTANTVASAEINNSTALDLYHDLTLTIAAQGTARQAGAAVVVYMVHAVDGTNYDDVNHVTGEVVAIFPLDAATNGRHLTRRDIPIPPGRFKYFARNTTGQTLAATGNILEYRPHSVETL